MGVTLERVQNKFACIIGELCSEPVVLSQFAIWLDLRLAEYKAKGAISLDCSGDNPEPSWLNGHRLLSKKSSSRFGGLSPQNSQPGMPGEMSWSRISAERSSSQSPSYDSMTQGMVKQEPLDQEDVGVFPISLHPHEMPESRTPNRKRNAAETISSEQELLSSTKSRRLTPPHHPSTSATDPTSNQSLMSIISSEMPENQAPVTVETVDLTDSDMNIIMSYEDKQAPSTPSRGENSRASFTSQNNMTPGGDTPSRVDDSINTDHDQVDKGRLRDSQTTSYPFTYSGQGEESLFQTHSGEPYMCQGRQPQHLHLTEIRKRIAPFPEKSPATIAKMVSSIGNLERWLWKNHKENRVVEDISPQELDKYLSIYFTEVKRPNGLDYDCHTLCCLKSNLDKFLKEKGYPSISKSHEFLRSQIAWRNRRKIAVGLSQQSETPPPELAPKWCEWQDDGPQNKASSSGSSSAWKAGPGEMSDVCYAAPENLKSGLTDRQPPVALEPENLSRNPNSNLYKLPVKHEASPHASSASRSPPNKVWAFHHYGPSETQRSSAQDKGASNNPTACGPELSRSSGDVKMDASFALLMMSLQQDTSQALSEDDKLWCTNVKPFMYPSNYPETLRNQYIRARIVDCGGKPPQTIVDMVTAVATVERWMWKKYSETRSIEDIPPSELDSYLTEFYPILRRPNGKEYDPKSLTNFKSRLDRFLKEKQYPCSINKSNVFVSSQQAFAGKRRSIIAKRAQLTVRPPESPN